MSDTHPSHAEVTRLLQELRTGDDEALDRLLPVVYERLRQLASLQLRGERSNHTLRTTALVHEAYLKIVGHHEVDWEDRAHFFAVASRAMRQVLIDYARKKSAEKRGSNPEKFSLDERFIDPGSRAESLVALDEALTRLGQIDERQSKVVEYRFFGGMNVRETAVLLEVSPSTVKRDWRTAKAWLYREMKEML